MLGEFTGQNQSDSVAGLANSSGEREWTTYEVWISRDEMVDFLL